MDRRTLMTDGLCQEDGTVSKQRKQENESPDKIYYNHIHTLKIRQGTCSCCSIASSSLAVTVLATCRFVFLLFVFAFVSVSVLQVQVQVQVQV